MTNGNGRSLMTTLGLIEGEVVTYLEGRGSSTLRQVVQEVEGPARLIMMATGSLIRKGIIAGYQRELEVLLRMAAANGNGNGDGHENGGAHAQP